MVQALGGAANRPAPAPDVQDDPGTPVEPMDVPDPGSIPDAEFPIDGRGSRVRIGGEGVTVSTDIEGVPLDLRVDRDGVRIEPGQASQLPPDQPPNSAPR